MADNTAGQTRTVSTDQNTVGQFATGKIVYDATSITTTDYTRVEVGFKPTYISFLNFTDRVGLEWQEGMTASQNLRTVAAGTRTPDTTANGVVVDDKGFRILQDATLAVVLASKTIYWRAVG